MHTVLHRIPVVAGLAYIERVRRLPSSFTATLLPEPDNRYFQNAVAVISGGEKIGYLAPEISRRYFEPLVARGNANPVTCPGRRATHADHETSGVELLLDFTELGVEAAE
ncbi:MAG TPA: HIRAN domain-containing protein [Vicinamibacterales bacterium]